MEVESDDEDAEIAEINEIAAAAPAAAAAGGVGRGCGKRKSTLTPTFKGYKSVVLQGVGPAYAKRVAQHERDQFGGNLANDEHYRYMIWKPCVGLSKKFEGGDVFRRVGFCPFRHEAECGYRVQETCWGSTDDALSLRDFDEGGWQHAEHSVTTKRVNHISMAMKCSVTPAVLKLQPKEFVNTLREVGGFAINAACAKSCKSWQVLRRNATNFGAAGLAPGQQHTWGGVNTMLESWKVEPLDMHQVYVVGDCLCNVQTKRLVAVLSTENLLLNGYRVLQFGMPLQLLVDTTWRLVVEGHGTILVGCMGLDQHFHIIAYAVVSKEDTDGHEHAFKQVKAGVEAVVAKYQRLQLAL